MNSDSQVVDLNASQKSAIEVIIPRTEQPKPSRLRLAFNFVFGCLLKPEPKIFTHYSKVEEEAIATKRVLIIYQDVVYDVTGFLDRHPGGKQILMMANSKIVDKLFDRYHYPLGSARTQMKKMKIGEVKLDVSANDLSQSNKV